jgi:hypothetical protein
MSTINVNFEVTGVNRERGVAYVKYWADGATVERFQADIGPYEIAISPNLFDASTSELTEYIANIGRDIVIRQKNAMDADANGSANAFLSLLDQQSNTSIEI